MLGILNNLIIWTLYKYCSAFVAGIYVDIQNHEIAIFPDSVSSEIPFRRYLPPCFA